MVEAINKIKRYTEKMDYDKFTNDEKTIDAILRNIEIIGEAARNISEDVKTKYPEVDWKEIADMRNKFIHGYFGVNLRIVWYTVTHDIPKLEPHVEKIVKNENLK